MTRFYHYTDKPFILDPTRTYSQRETDMKPRGLWLSADDDWQRWCESEDFNIESLARREEIVLTDDADVLRLESPEAIDHFTVKYRRNTPRTSLEMIDWKRVTDEWQGIIITPYCWERRLTTHTLWYYGWDCASGCIWDLAAIKGVRSEALTHHPQ